MRTAPVLASLFLLGVCSAGTITITETGTATGTLGSNSFTNSQITVIFTGNTANTSCGFDACVNFGGTLTINVASLSQTVSLTDQPGAYSDFSPAEGGLGDENLDSSILATQKAAFAAYNLASSLGPVTGPYFSNLNLAFPTTGGNLTLTSAGANSTFTATVAPATTPEPAPIVLVVVGLAALAGLRYYSASLAASASSSFFK